MYNQHDTYWNGSFPTWCHSWWGNQWLCCWPLQSQTMPTMLTMLSNVIVGGGATNACTGWRWMYAVLCSNITSERAPLTHCNNFLLWFSFSWRLSSHFPACKTPLVYPISIMFHLYSHLFVEHPTSFLPNFLIPETFKSLVSNPSSVHHFAPLFHRASQLFPSSVHRLRRGAAWWRRAPWGAAARRGPPCPGGTGRLTLRHGRLHKNMGKQWIREGRGHG